MPKYSRHKVIQELYALVMNGNESAFKDLMRLWQIDNHLVSKSLSIAEIMADIFFCKSLPVEWKEEMWNLRDNVVCYEYRRWIETKTEYRDAAAEDYWMLVGVAHASGTLANTPSRDYESDTYKHEVEKEGYCPVSFKEYILDEPRYLEVLKLYGYI